MPKERPSSGSRRPPATPGGASGPAAPAGKISVVCPHCAVAQFESVYVQTTLCRKCGRYFNVEATPEAEQPGLIGGWMKKLGRMMAVERVWEVRCYHCRSTHSVSTAAESSMCPQCGVYMDLRDYTIKGPYNRTIETYGRVIIKSRGELTSPKVVCGNAVIRGKVHGAFVCPGTVKIKWHDRMLAAFDVGELIVEKGSAMEFVRPVKAKKFRVLGKASAIVHADLVHIPAKGVLEGNINAKAVDIEKGGIFTGSLSIGLRPVEQADLLAAVAPAADAAPKAAPDAPGGTGPKGPGETDPKGGPGAKPPKDPKDPKDPPQGGGGFDVQQQRSLALG